MSQQTEIRDAARDMREYLLQTMQQPGRAPGKDYRKGVASLEHAVRDQITRFVDELSTTVREEVDEFTKAAWEVHNKD